MPFAKVRPGSTDGVEDGTGPETAIWRARVHALRIVRELGGGTREENSRVEQSPWAGDNRQYRRYPFPRSALLSTIEDAVHDPSGPATQGILRERLNSRGWRPNGARPSVRLREAAKDGSKTVPALLIAVLAAQLGEKPWYAVGFSVLVLVLVVVLGVLPGRAPLLLGLRREIRWFLGTTYLDQGPHADRREGRRWRTLRLWPPGSVRQRLNAVATDIAAGSLLDGAAAAGADEDAQRRHLQLRVHALREDLRDAHRVWSLDLRGRKRPTPPMLLLPRADAENGGIELIKALSDIRSIRSELDPLLIVASVPGARVGDLHHTAEWYGDAPAHPDAQLPGWYTEWNQARRVNQSPSIDTGQLPWVLRVPVSLTQPDLGYSRRTLGRVQRPGWTWLWSIPALVLVLLAAAAGAVVEDRHRAATYCDGGLLASNHDSVWKEDQNQQDTECVGVVTGSVPLTGLEEVQKLIQEANAEIGDDPHVTLVYAGPLSGDPADELVKGLEELRGAYAVQRAKRYKSVKLKILVANGGKDMYNQRTMVDRLVDLSRRDPSIVGVVGMGRDMTDSEEVQTELREASLPVVSGTNSSTTLAEDYPNFFGLAATDKWQNDQLRGIAERLADESQSGPKPRAAVLARTPESHDQYTKEQKKYAKEMLKAAGFDVSTLKDYELPNSSATLDDQIADVCVNGQASRVVYFAGRAEDVATLLDGLDSSDCGDDPIAIIGGDDLSKARLATGTIQLPPKLTVYYPILTALECAAPYTDFYNRLNQLPADERKDLGPEGKATWRSPGLANGQTALTHDATEVLYHAATADGRPRNRAETWANLRQQKVSGLATGTIDFTGIAPHRPRKGYGITLMQVGHGKDGSNMATVKLRQAAGSTDKLAQDCPKS
ncbi:ABC transporter substrate-binding protein [Streptomyces physcomitrii]|uniref:ABC transporter substrate-binding protein n=1 Tax=Streptomyces physcomitrii TaxID=2724184 RepID=UPI0034291C76